MTIEPIQAGAPRFHLEGAPVQPDDPHRSDTVRPAYAGTAVRPCGMLAPDRLALMSQRLLTGFYDTEAVRQIIAERLLRDLKMLE